MTLYRTRPECYALRYTMKQEISPQIHTRGRDVNPRPARAPGALTRTAIPPRAVCRAPRVATRGLVRAARARWRARSAARGSSTTTPPTTATPPPRPASRVALVRTLAQARRRARCARRGGTTTTRTPARTARTAPRASTPPRTRRSAQAAPGARPTSTATLERRARSVPKASPALAPQSAAPAPRARHQR